MACYWTSFSWHIPFFSPPYSITTGKQSFNWSIFQLWASQTKPQSVKIHFSPFLLQAHKLFVPSAPKISVTQMVCRPMERHVRPMLHTTMKTALLTAKKKKKKDKSLINDPTLKILRKLSMCLSNKTKCFHRNNASIINTHPYPKVLEFV